MSSDLKPPMPSKYLLQVSIAHIHKTYSYTYDMYVHMVIYSLCIHIHTDVRSYMTFRLPVDRPLQTAYWWGILLLCIQAGFACTLAICSASSGSPCLSRSPSRSAWLQFRDYALHFILISLWNLSAAGTVHLILPILLRMPVSFQYSCPTSVAHSNSRITAVLWGRIYCIKPSTQIILHVR